MHQQNITPPNHGEPFAGGFFGGVIFIDNALHALIVAPKAEGEHEDAAWNDSLRRVDGACAYADGLTNTKAMAEADSKLAQWALGLDIGGFSDWYLPSMDELEILYRNLKPTANKNYLYGRAGINVSAAPPTYPYTADAPAQTACAGFAEGGVNAFGPVWYWSSTQHASSADYAWYQGFCNGRQFTSEASRLSCAPEPSAD